MNDWKVDLPRRRHPACSARAASRAQSGGDVAVFRNAEDKVFALLDRCPHKGGPLSQGIVFGDSVACPLHNWTIGLADGCAAAPDDGCAQRFCVRVEDGAVALDLAELADSPRRSRTGALARAAVERAAAPRADADARNPLHLPLLRRRLRRDHRDRGRRRSPACAATRTTRPTSAACAARAARCT